VSLGQKPSESPTRTAITIGSFDGVHAGHTALVRKARQLVGEDGRVVAMTFDPHPATVLAPERLPSRLSTLEQRVRYLREQGADLVVPIVPTPELLATEPDDFIANLVALYRPSWFVEGGDFHFGRARAGGPATLAVLGRAMGFGVEIVDAVDIALTDGTLARASSSLVRWLLSNGRVADAAAVLGRPYELDGVVTQGDQRGRTIGFPTANLTAQQMLPADGVYACTCTLPDAREAIAAVNIGDRPTFNGTERRVEAHILDEDLFSLGYGWTLRLCFVAPIRDQVRFDNLESLRRQLHRDIDRCRSLVACSISTPLPG
jgi:riboflavin kinase/FMN adenylyltransferase